MTELIYKDEVYEIVGAAMDIHKELGWEKKKSHLKY